MRAPSLNGEIKSALKAPQIRKDGAQSVSQNQVGAALSSVGGAVSFLLNLREEEDKDEGKWTKEYKTLITDLSNAGKILADLHYYMSLARRTSITSLLDPIVRRVAEDSKVDSCLFGSDFTERLKSAQAVEKSSKSIAKQSRPKAYPTMKQKQDQEVTRPPPRASSSRHLNYYPPPWGRPRRGTA